jgi:L-ascorbate metabolism protein UlaG (beta-lactamase superfamily)
MVPRAAGAATLPARVHTARRARAARPHRPWARRAAIGTAIGVSALSVSALALHLGWLSRPRPWPSATGWDRLASDLRPAVATRPWPDAPGRPAPRLYWLGHSGFLLEWGGTRLLLDPNTSDWCTVSRRRLEPAAALESLGAVDAVLISHAHFDHLDLPSLRRLPGRPEIVVPAGSEELVRLPGGRRRTIGLTLWQSATIGALEVIAVPAQHNGGRLHPLHSRRLAVGYVVRLAGDAIYFAGDTGTGEHFAAIGKRYRPRLALLPIGAYAPRWPIGRVHLNPEQAVEAARQLGCELVMPMHFGTFALALDRPAAALPRFARAARAHQLRWLMPRLLRAGERPAALAATPAAALAAVGG